MRVREYTWVLYPVVAAILIVFSGQWVLSSGQTGLAFLKSKTEDLKQQDARAAQLKQKVDALNGVKSQVVSGELQQLVTAVPAVKQASLVLSEIGSASTASGAIVVGYKSPQIGDVKEATASGTPASDVSAFAIDVDVQLTGDAQLQQFMADLENQMPILRVTKIKYQSNRATVTVSPAFSPWTKVDQQTDNPLPDYGTQVAGAVRAISGYAPAVEDNSSTLNASNSGGIVSPF